MHPADLCELLGARDAVALDQLDLDAAPAHPEAAWIAEPVLDTASLDAVLHRAQRHLLPGAVLVLTVGDGLNAEQRLGDCLSGVTLRPGPQGMQLVCGLWSPPITPANSGIAERLMAREATWFEQVQRNIELQAALERREQSVSVSAFDLPQDRHPWPLRDEPGRHQSELGLYDRRPDDAVLLEARSGQAFLLRHGLQEGGSPDFAAAVAELNAAPRRTRYFVESHEGVPDISIVIPIYGQLSFTLNALDSLFALASRHSAEIIVIDDRSPDSSGQWLPQVHGIRYHLQPVNGGFVESCNTGAAMARAPLVMMLNNDVRVVAGCLDELIESFEILPQAGLVGSKLYNEDGSLQECGGIIWRDGSAWNLGRDDDPNRPAWCHARETDYVSGCAIVVPTALWHQLGGFSTIMKPAYAEDSDLAFKVRKHGLKTWVQPTSRVIHYEGKTSGRDITKGVKAYQVINSRKLFHRWRDVLAGHRPNGFDPMLERERAVTRRALVVDALMPTPTEDAGSVTTMQTLQLYRDLGYKVHFVPQDNFLYDPENTPKLHRQGVETAYAPFDLDFEHYLRRHGPLIDIVQVYRFETLRRTLPILRRVVPQTPVIFHNMDLHYLRMEREAHVARNESLAAEAATMKQAELSLIRAVDCTITHSTHERDLLASEVPGAPVAVWPFMFDVRGTKRGFSERSGYGFLGGYRHKPNIDAVVYFLKEIFPRIRKADPSAVFYVIGANPPDELRALNSSHVVVTGMIEDLADVLDKIRVFVCPLRIGAGVKGKVSVAMAYGLPVVTTSIGAEGIELEDGRNVVIADDPAVFAKAALRLHRDAALWQSISAEGMALVAEKHSMSMGRQVLSQALTMAFDHRYLRPRADAPEQAPQPQQPAA